MIYFNKRFRYNIFKELWYRGTGRANDKGNLEMGGETHPSYIIE